MPYFAITIVLHRLDQITTPQAYWLLGIGLIILLVSMMLGVRAFFDLWNSGRRGGKATLRGMLLAAILLAPYGWWAYLGLAYPTLNDVSTNLETPPEFTRAEEFRRLLNEQGINQFAEYDAEYAGRLLDAYPLLASRRYNSGAERILDAVRSLFEAKGWEVTSVRGGPSARPDGDGEAASGAGDTGPAAGELGALPGDILVEGVARSRIFGFRQDIVLAIQSEAESTLVDMRAATRWGAHDFSRNFKTITSFLSDLDKALVGIAGEG